MAMKRGGSERWDLEDRETGIGEGAQGPAFDGVGECGRPDEGECRVGEAESGSRQMVAEVPCRSDYQDPTLPVAFRRHTSVLPSLRYRLQRLHSEAFEGYNVQDLKMRVLPVNLVKYEGISCN